ncbi:carbohydrate sulfotransferase 10-like [Babylonia areolata]|uniref:carbohydrate sulfotransferase 10-like n=1 Tax=Babylonia areolata TaxID=304850 RepID=UPI003FD5F7A1
MRTKSRQWMQMAGCWRRFFRHSHVMLGALLLLALLTSLWLQFPAQEVPSLDDMHVRLSTEIVPNATRPGADVISGVFGARWSHYQTVCDTVQDSGGVPGLVQNPLVYLPANLTVCWVPKVGCTFWKRIFFYLHDDAYSPWTSKPVKSPFDIDRIFVHLHGGKKKSLRFDDEREHDVIFHTRRVMFARDPWSRLWSDYVDKFVLPDSWLDHGKRILMLRDRLVHSDGRDSTRHTWLAALSRQSGSSGEGRSPTGNDSKVCADDVSFAEFLHYALLVNHDAHWSPVHLTCNPCVFRPQLMGKFETFSRDASYVLHTSGLGDLLPDLSHSGHVRDEIQLLVDYHFRLWEHRWELQACLDQVSVAHRLWRSFQLNGYLPQTSVFPREMLTRRLNHVPLLAARDLFTRYVISVSSAWPLNHSEWLNLRRTTMAEAYRSVPQYLLHLVQDRFRLDFQLFQYDSAPRDFFRQC